MRFPKRLIDDVLVIPLHDHDNCVPYIYIYITVLCHIKVPGGTVCAHTVTTQTTMGFTSAVRATKLVLYGYLSMPLQQVGSDLGIQT